MSPVHTILPAALSVALKGTLILAAALGATSLMRRSPAAARHAVWLAALLGVLALPVLEAVVPAWRVLPALPTLRMVPAATSEPTVTEHAPAAAASEAAPVAPAPSPEAAAPAPSVAPAASPSAAAAGLGAGALLLLLWAAGAALLAARLLWGVARLRWIERRAVEVTDEAWLRMADRLTRRLGLGRIVRLLRGPDATVPMTWGVLRPVVLLPDEAEGWSDERRAVVLAHELAHIRRWDALTQWVSHLATALYWFHPLVWVAAHRLRQEREHACDDAVLEIGTRPSAYADHLLTLVRGLGSAPGPAAALAMARRSQFEGRLLAILDHAARRGGTSRGVLLATVLGAAACIVPLAALRAAEPGAAETAASGASAAAFEAAEEPEVRAVAVAPLAPVATASPAAAGTAPAVPAAPGADTGTADMTEAVAAAAALTDESVRAEYLERVVEKAAMVRREGVRWRGPSPYAQVARAAASIASPSARRRVLVAVATCPEVDREGLLATLEATRGMPAGAELREVLAAFPGSRRLSDAAVRSGWFAALGRAAPGADRRELLSVALRSAPRDAEVRAGVLRGTRTLTEPADQREVLVEVARGGALSGGLRELYLQAARAIRQESDRAEALSALVGETARPSGSGGRDVLVVDGAVGDIVVQGSRGVGDRDSDGWTTHMRLNEGTLAFTDPAGGGELHLQGRDFVVQSRGGVARVVLQPGGHATLEETGSPVRRLAIRSGGGGESRAFTLGGRPWTDAAAARAWEASFLRRLHAYLHRDRAAGRAASRPAPARRGTATRAWNASDEIVSSHHGQPSYTLNLRARDVVLALDAPEVVGIERGGSLAIDHTLHAAYPDADPLRPRGSGATLTRSLRGTPAADGSVRWTYRVNGVERPFGEEGRAWLAAVLRSRKL